MPDVFFLLNCINFIRDETQFRFDHIHKYAINTSMANGNGVWAK